MLFEPDRYCDSLASILCYQNTEYGFFDSIQITKEKTVTKNNRAITETIGLV